MAKKLTDKQAKKKHPEMRVRKTMDRPTGTQVHKDAKKKNNKELCRKKVDTDTE